MTNITGNSTDPELLAKISGAQKKVEKTEGTKSLYQTRFEVTLANEICVSEAVHDYASDPYSGEKFSCKKEGACTCATKNELSTKDGDICELVTFIVSGGSGKQETADCKTGKTFKFTVTADDEGLPGGEEVYQRILLISPAAAPLTAADPGILREHVAGDRGFG